MITILCTRPSTSIGTNTVNQYPQLSVRKKDIFSEKNLSKDYKNQPVQDREQNAPLFAVLLHQKRNLSKTNKNRHF